MVEWLALLGSKQEVTTHESWAIIPAAPKVMHVMNFV